uniref:Uncharacterized protein n=1 Tax=Arundo donax TaxID=35708 RepID=A0A0A8ZQB5_ARUDO
MLEPNIHSFLLMQYKVTVFMVSPTYIAPGDKNTRRPAATPKLK